jgi:hypothetical protein
LEEKRLASTMGSKEKAAMNKPPAKAIGHDMTKVTATNGY